MDNTPSNSYKVVIYNQTYSLRSEHGPEYINEVLPVGTKRLAIEAASPFGWERWIGNDPHLGAMIGINHFGASAPYQRIYKEFGLTPEHAVAKAKQLLGK